MKKDLYKWQKDCLREWEANHRRGIAHVVTGAGKTILAIAAIESVRGLFPDLMVRIVVPTIPLARQWETALRHHMGADASGRPHCGIIWERKNGGRGCTGQAGVMTRKDM